MVQDFLCLFFVGQCFNLNLFFFIGKFELFANKIKSAGYHVTVNLTNGKKIKFPNWKSK